MEEPYFNSFLINRMNVMKEPSKDMNACEDWSHIAATMSVCVMSSAEDKPCLAA